MDVYEDRYVAFVDILGFGSLVDRADKDPDLREAIANALRTARQVAAPEGSETRLQFHFFSDSIIATSKRSEDGLWHLLLSMDALTNNLLNQDIWVRGAVAVGGVYDDPDLVFGTGINKAYSLESAIAVYPRIILNRDVLNDSKNYANQSSWAANYYTSRIRRDMDGVHYLHFLVDYVALNSFEKTDADASEEQLIWAVQGRRIRDMIQARVDLTVDNPKVYAKAEWLASYWNETVVGRRFETNLFLKSIALAGSANTETPLPFRGSPA